MDCFYTYLVVWWFTLVIPSLSVPRCWITCTVLVSMNLSIHMKYLDVWLAILFPKTSHLAGHPQPWLYL